jgi:hypothetical protein
MSWLCDGWKTFFRHSLPLFEKIAVSFLNERQAALPSRQRQHYRRLPAVDIKGNAPCYCGSGKKYKRCHAAGKAKGKRA